MKLQTQGYPNVNLIPGFMVSTLCTGSLLIY